MYKKHYTPLFAMVMLMMLAPFASQVLSTKPADADTVAHEAVFPAGYDAATAVSMTDIISTGYVGQYRWIEMPERARNPQVLGISTVASPPPAYRAEVVEKSHGYLTLSPGQSITVWVDFLNTGGATWRRTGDHFVALNVAGPAGRDSLFRHAFWNEYYYRPARLLQDEVKPGEMGRFRFALQAPATVATYLEEFHLVAENLTWIEGGYTNFTIGVGQNPENVPQYRAQEVERSIGGMIAVEPGAEFTFWVDFKNTGTKTWYNTGSRFIALNVTNPVGRVSPFKHDYWNEYYYRPARLEQSAVHPGETGRFRFALTVPNVDDYYVESFGLVAENFQWIAGGSLTLGFKVGDPPAIEPVYAIEDEPAIRVGLYATDEPVNITASTPYSVTDVAADETTSMPADEITKVNITDGTYVRIIPQSADGIVTVTNCDNSPLWNSSLNDNTFRGTIEVRYSEEADTTWVINELPLESYLRGLAEVSNGQPDEYLKALITAARSYALWHMLNGGKHPDEFYDINATTDQVYRGYGFEQRSEDPLSAVIATTGTVITHPDAVSQINPDGVAIAAYSSGTDGRTRNWTEVWAGSGFPWLVSVDDPHGAIPNWNTLQGNHMVGMSAMGARGYAVEELKTYDWILKHYYTGVAVEKLY
ncbi:MAG: SpoIID/LytB domain-containing protein [Patescibacteria group bacterium]